jgi:hypothetical protein
MPAMSTWDTAHTGPPCSSPAGHTPWCSHLGGREGAKGRTCVDSATGEKSAPQDSRGLPSTPTLRSHPRDTIQGNAAQLVQACSARPEPQVSRLGAGAIAASAQWSPTQVAEAATITKVPASPPDPQLCDEWVCEALEGNRADLSAASQCDLMATRGGRLLAHRHPQQTFSSIPVQHPTEHQCGFQILTQR